MSTNEPSSINRWLANIPAGWIGRLFLVSGLLFWAVGAYYMVTSLALDRSLEEKGRVVDGTVLEKIVGTTSQRIKKQGQRGMTKRTTYSVSFSFPASGETITGKVEVDKDVWDGLREQGPIKVTYLPDEPEIHRVEGQDPAFSLWKLLIAAVGGGVMLFIGKFLAGSARTNDVPEP